jgi:SanA protein
VIRLVAGGLIAAAALLALPWVWQQAVQLRYAGRTYTVENAPAAGVAIVFGARVYGGGRLSPMLSDRVDTAAALYAAGKVETLIMSGGQNGEEYDEPAAMAAQAVRQGVPPGAILLDYGGLRTYDTCYRAVEVYGVTEALLVTQAFHLPRALLLCDGLGMAVAGVAADRRLYSSRSLAWSELREVPALMSAALDLIRRSPPTIPDH